MTELPPNPRSPVPGWQEVLDAPVLLGDGPRDEMARNTWLLQASGRQRAGTSDDELLAWIERLVADRRAKVRAAGLEATFYTWLDDTTGALGVGLVSGRGAELPFNGRVRRLESPAPLVAAFLRRSLAGVAWPEVGEPAGSSPLLVEPDVPVIDVYVVEL